MLGERAQYIHKWVRVFYATLFVGNERRYIQLMFPGGKWRLDRARLAERLGVTIALDPVSLQALAYGDSKAPHCAHDSIFPPDQEVSVLFQ